MKPNCYEMQDMKTETLKEALKYLYGSYAPLWGYWWTEMFYEFSERKRLDVFKRYWSLGDISAVTGQGS